MLKLELSDLATRTGFEPVIHCSTGRHVNHYTNGPNGSHFDNPDLADDAGDMRRQSMGDVEIEVCYLGQPMPTGRVSRASASLLPLVA